MPEKVIAFQGERGAFSEIAAKHYFGKNVNTLPCQDFESVFKSIKNHIAEYGVIPIENSSYGSVYETYDLLNKYDLPVSGEINLRVDHYLLSDKKYPLNKISVLYSHPQALGQCSKYIKKIKNAEVIPVYDTAGAAKLLSKRKKDVPAAAIASRFAAKEYGLKILSKKIQNNKNNLTRFLIISGKKRRVSLKNSKTSICFELKSIPGALFKALSVFALREIDLLKIESRPIPNKPFQYLFYADLRGNSDSQTIKNALKQLSEISVKVRNFGSYSAGKTFNS